MTSPSAAERFCSIDSLFGQTVFAVGRLDYHWEDVVLGAKLRGEWPALERLNREGLACFRRAAATGEAVGRQEVDAEATRFRYERNLVSAAETEVWLRGWGLSTEAWMDALERATLRRKWPAELTEILAAHAPTDAEVERHLKADGIASGMLRDFAQQLALRAALHAWLTERSVGFAAGTAERVRDMLQAFPPDVRDGGLAGLPADRCRQSMERVAGLEASFQLFQQQPVPAAALASAVEAHRLDWTCFLCQTAVFPSADAAREAALCLREDAAPLAEVAARARTEARLSRFHLEDIEAPSRSSFAGCGTGAVVGPLKEPGGFALYQVVERVAPDTDDPEIRMRAAEAVRAKTIATETAARVRWRARL